MKGAWMQRAEAVAAEKAGFKDAGWFAWAYMRVDNGILITGAICPLLTKGPNKGGPNYRKADPKTKRIIFIGMDEVP